MPDIQDYWNSLSDEDHRIASEALEKSIQHWRENVEAEELDEASIKAEDCALCELFANDDAPSIDGCELCPVRFVTGRVECMKSPYDQARYAFRNWRHGADTREAFTAAAQAELDFLISLRPKEKRG